MTLSRRSVALGLCAWPTVAMPRSGRIELDAGQRHTELPFELIDQRLFVDAEVAGEAGPAALLKLVFDTGGSNILDLSVAQRLGLPLRERFEMPGAGAATLPAWRTAVRSARVGTVTMHEIGFVVMPLAEIRQAIGFERLDGLLGRELLARFVVQLDFGRSRIVLHEPGAEPPLGAHERELPLQFAGSLPAVRGTIEGREASLALDCGDRSALTLFGPFVESRGLRSRASGTARQVTGWGVGGPLLADLLRLDSLSLGDLSLPRVLARMPVGEAGVFSSRLADASIGTGVLRHLNPTFDYRQRTLRLRWVDPAGPIGLADRSGMWLRRPDAWGGDFEVHWLAADGPAARAGLSAGERIVAIDGLPCRTIVLASWRERLAHVPAGTVLRLALAGDRERKLVLGHAP